MGEKLKKLEWGGEEWAVVYPKIKPIVERVAKGYYRDRRDPKKEGYKGLVDALMALAQNNYQSPYARLKLLVDRPISNIEVLPGQVFDPDAPGNIDFQLSALTGLAAHAILEYREASAPGVFSRALNIFRR